MPHVQMVTYNQTVEGLTDIYTTSAIIESTSLVLGVGLDIFFMRTAPSKTFDMLPADFNRPLLLMLLGGLGTGVFAAAHFSKRKRIQAAWK